MDEGMTWLPAILILPYFILLLKIYRSLRKIKKFEPEGNPSTFVSVVIACRNEQVNLPRLLDNLASQNYPSGLFEIIVVNDHSSDNTYRIASDFKSRNVIVLNSTGKGKKQALRTGIENAKGSLIITTDADCIMDKNWVGTIAGFYEHTKAGMIICPVNLESVRSIWGKLQELEFLSLQGVTAGTAISGEPVMCNGANLAFEKKIFLLHSGNLHDEINSGDDIFLLHSLKKEKQSRILWLESPLALVTTRQASTFSNFIKQRSRWISKSPSYKDSSTIVIGIVTFVAIFLQLFYFVWMIINPAVLIVFLTLLILKSIPDFLILWNTTKRYKSRNLMKLFFPAQLVYPIYTFAIIVYASAKYLKH